MQEGFVGLTGDLRRAKPIDKDAISASTANAVADYCQGRPGKVWLFHIIVTEKPDRWTALARVDWDESGYYEVDFIAGYTFTRYHLFPVVELPAAVFEEE